MTNAWLNRWENDQTGWHQPKGHSSIEQHWRPGPGSVLVPLCGKTFDMIKLAELGHHVTGVEVSEKAARQFFNENGYHYQKTSDEFPEYKGHDIDVRIVVADFFDFTEAGFAAVYDRAALVALPPDARPRYARHLQERMDEDAFQLLVSIDYDQTLIAGPPYAVADTEIRALYPELTRVDTYSDLQNSPPKFAAAGIKDLRESVWVSSTA